MEYAIHTVAISDMVQTFFSFFDLSYSLVSPCIRYEDEIRELGSEMLNLGIHISVLFIKVVRQ